MKILGPEEFELVVSDIKTLFERFKLIELKFDVQTSQKMMDWLVDVIKDNESYMWDSAIKNSLNLYLSISYGFANQFLKEELLLNNVSETELMIFKDLGKINFIRLQQDVLVPSFSFGYEIGYDIIENRTRRWLQYILENSSSEGVRKYKMMNFFDGDPEQQLSNVLKYLNERIGKILEEEFKSMNESLNNYIDGLSRKFC